MISTTHGYLERGKEGREGDHYRSSTGIRHLVFRTMGVFFLFIDSCGKLLILHRLHDEV
jgi:hypothetical protein